MYVQTQYKRMNDGVKFLKGLEKAGMIDEVKEGMYDHHTLEYTFKIVEGYERVVIDKINKNKDIIKH